ncbi:MAG: ROK family protein [Lentisphaerae bacterium]|nr:ROK family protein [Lentisphaerota bacterium]
MAETTKKGDGRAVWIGVDIGGTKILAVAFDDRMKPLGEDRKKTKGRSGAEESIQRVAAAVEGAIKAAGLSAKDVAGIGVGCPGPVSMEKGVVLSTPNLCWKDVPLRQILEKKFGVPAAVVNDVDAGVYGEYAMGAGKGARCVFGIFPGTGIGGGCVYEGKIVCGRNTSCFEIGHCRVMPKGPICGCGRRGCLEAVAGRLAISSAAAAAAYRGEAPALLALAGTDLGCIRSGDLAAAIAAGDSEVERVVRRAARWVGCGASLVINLMAPDKVILGGGLVEAMPELYLEEVRKGAMKHVMPSLRGVAEVVVAKLGDRATVTGAAAWARGLAVAE